MSLHKNVEKNVFDVSIISASSIAEVHSHSFRILKPSRDLLFKPGMKVTGTSFRIFSFKIIVTFHPIILVWNIIRI